MDKPREKPDYLTKSRYDYDEVSNAVLKQVAWWLWLDAWWNEERENKYCDHCEVIGKQWEQRLTNRPETPPIPDEDAAINVLRKMVDCIEYEWERGFVDVAFDMEDVCNLADLVYQTLMACMGHGIGPDDDGGFPSDLEEAPICFDNPLFDQDGVWGDSVPWEAPK